MTIDKAVLIGLAGNEISKKIAGTDEASIGRTILATASGGVVGAAAAGTLVVSSLAAAPVTIPLAMCGAVIAGIASLFD